MKKIYSFLLLLLPFYAHAQSGIINTILDTCCGWADSAGLYSTGYYYSSGGFCVDASENIFIPDFGHNVIKKTSVSGVITVMAGTGSAGYSGDGGPATAAQFNLSIYDSGSNGAIAIDRWGNMYVSDNGNHRVRKIDTNGIVTTIAGTGVAGNTGDGGAAVTAQISGPTAICVDRMGNVYFFQRYTHTIRKINTAGTISTIAGNGSTFGLIHFWFSSAIPATSSNLDRVYKLTVDGDGNLYTLGNLLLLKITPLGFGSALTYNNLAGHGSPAITGHGGPITAAENGPIIDIAVDNRGNLYLACADGKVLRRVNRFGNVFTISGAEDTLGYNGDGVPMEEARYHTIFRMDLNQAGDLYLFDDIFTQTLIRKITFESDIITDSFSTYLHSRCSGIDFLTITDTYSPSHTIVTQFGDGTTDTANTLAGYGGGYMSISHDYSAAGTYTIRQKLYDATTLVDSVIHSYTHRFCNNVTLRSYMDNNNNCNLDSSEALTCTPIRV
jgi:hypothetical protein